jgi:hypothetical protein
MVTMRMRNDGAVYWLPGVDVEVSRLAVEAALCEGEEGHGER